MNFGRKWDKFIIKVQKSSWLDFIQEIWWPVRKTGSRESWHVCDWQALACYRLLESGESESNKIGWGLERDGTHFFAAYPLSRFSTAPTRFSRIFFSLSAHGVSHKTGYATSQDEQNPLFWLAAPRDWDWTRKRICKTILVNSGLPFANYACAFKSAVLLKRTVNQIQGLLSNPFSDFPKGMADDEIPVHFTHQI